MEPSNRKELEAQLLLQSWETLQGLAKSNGESAWMVRAWAVTVWAALLAYSYTANEPSVAIVGFVQLVASFFIELAIRQVQYKFIERSLEVEESLNSMLVGDELNLPPNGISTKISTPTLSDLLALLTPRRWLVWFPYLLLAGFTWVAIKVNS